MHMWTRILARPSCTALPRYWRNSQSRIVSSDMTRHDAIVTWNDAMLTRHDAIVLPALHASNGEMAYTSSHVIICQRISTRTRGVEKERRSSSVRLQFDRPAMADFIPKHPTEGEKAISFRFAGSETETTPFGLGHGLFEFERPNDIVELDCSICPRPQFCVISHVSPHDQITSVGLLILSLSFCPLFWPAALEEDTILVTADFPLIDCTTSDLRTPVNKILIN